MDQYGFIHEKLDIKLLILFVLRRLPGVVEHETLRGLVMCDGGIGYFDYTDCLSELVTGGNVEETKEALPSRRRALATSTRWRAACPIPCAKRPRGFSHRCRKRCGATTAS